MRVSANAVRITIFVAAVAGVVIILFVTGWANDKAPHGSKGRVPVTYTAPNGSR
jgi:hypothetical protein